MLTRTLALFATTLAFTALTACGGGDDPGDSSLTIDNGSSYILLEINVSPVDEASWGPDLLGSETLDPGDSLVIELDCDVYDIRILDDTNTECILESVDLCFEDAAWEIDDTELALCGF
jgi:hypothetical protein